ncbi:MAG: helix-turn-helix transcriptional regulator [Flavisolibacter sp.]
MSLYLQRIIRLYNRLRRGPVTIAIISEWAKNAGINVSERQLYRDLTSLQQLKIAEGENVVEYVDEKNKKTWKLEYDSSSERVSQFDINSFFLFKNFIPDSIQRQRKHSLEKFEEILYRNFSNNNYQQQVEAAELYLRKTNWWDISYGEVEHKILEDILWALQNKRMVTVLADDINTSKIDLVQFPFPAKLLPIELIFHEGRLYLGGLDYNTEKLLIYSVTDALKIELSNESFSRKKYLQKYKNQLSGRFIIAEPKDGKVYDIKLEFSRGYGLSMQKVFLHRTAKWKELENGNYMLLIRCGIGRDLLGFLGHSLDQVKVHQPKELEQLVIKKLHDMLKIYEGKEIDEDAANADY